MHPGVLVKEDIDRLKLSIYEVAQAGGLRRAHLTEITKGKYVITARTAIILEKTLGTRTAQEWLRLQAEHDIELAWAEHGEQLAGIGRIR